jgi:1-acyl-sn-glycerol-3-phosphate acyltransferase
MNQATSKFATKPQDNQINIRGHPSMPTALKYPLRAILIAFGRLLSHILFDIRIYGRENMPRNVRPLIVIANHFSWFDAPLLAIWLPEPPAFLVATESLRHWWVRLFVNVFDCIPVWRGQVDRNAFRKSAEALEKGLPLGIFPEGGMDPDVAERVARGEQIRQFRGHASRRSAQLARPRPGSALLAVQTKAHILPVGLLGTERILDNLKSFRRTGVIMRIGPMIGPFTIDPSLRGRARRQRLDELGDLMMQHIARLFPPENRGPYSNIS